MTLDPHPGRRTSLEGKRSHRAAPLFIRNERVRASSPTFRLTSLVLPSSLVVGA